jgi:hypothetical protein
LILFREFIMALIDHLLTIYRTNLFIVGKTVEDLTPDQMPQQPRPGMNHAAWILGHLAMPRFWSAENIKVPCTLPAGWNETFGFGTKPIADATLYPAKSELLNQLAETHRVMEAALQSMTENQLMAPGDPRIRHLLPTVGDGIIGLMSTHESFHIGQLSAWRRAMGLKSVF